SNTDDLAKGAYQPFIPDLEVNDAANIDRLVICSGKVYYDLYEYRQKQGIENVAIARLEQFYPFPDEDVAAFFKEYINIQEVVWCQEEPRNMGAWHFVTHRISQQLQEGQKLRYAGRQASASPAAGQMKIHKREQELLIKEALD